MAGPEWPRVGRPNKWTKLYRLYSLCHRYSGDSAAVAGGQSLTINKQTWLCSSPALQAQVACRSDGI